MSIIGSSVVAGISQAHLQAQQVARGEDHVSNQSARQARNTREAVAVRTESVEGDELSESGDQLAIQSEMPQGESNGGYAPPRRRPKGQSEDENAASSGESGGEEGADGSFAAAVSDFESEDSAGPGALYKHLDVRA